MSSNGLRRYLRLWFTFDSPVDRRTYFKNALILAVIKYVGDLVIVRLLTGGFWHPTDYFRVGPMHSELTSTALMPTLALWALPFVWIGTSMSMRRALDAGLTAWSALFFFVPFLKYVMMALLCVLPTRVPARKRPRQSDAPYARIELVAVASGALVGLGMMALSIFGLHAYGAALFFATPFVMGAISAWLLNRHHPASPTETYRIALISLAVVGTVALATAAEGMICLIMAAPLAVALGLMGASLGREIAVWGDASVSHALLGMMALPIMATLDANAAASPLREVRSAIEIDASPDVVWRNVIAFPPIPEPSDVIFRAGISYPQRAVIVGEGVGAIRYCVFSTGSFVEPITRWEPGQRLSFNVDSQPKPMQEWSPYADISPPHLDGYFRSRRGEFRLIALPGGRTRLEGSTWYEMRLQPAGYWSLYGDALIHRIHGRVLRHIRATAEAHAR